MDPKLLYWTGALLNMCAIAALALTGIRARRGGRIDRHRGRMLAAGCLVLLFLLSYGLKLLLLGREDRSAWSPGDLWTLRIHELCVLTMLAAGGIAANRGRLLRRTRNATGAASDPPAPPRLAPAHRAAGWTAVAAALLGLLTAAMVLAGMYRRAGLI